MATAIAAFSCVTVRSLKLCVEGIHTTIAQLEINCLQFQLAHNRVEVGNIQLNRS
jgi:hypothetical protein